MKALNIRLSRCPQGLPKLDPGGLFGSLGLLAVNQSVAVAA